MIGRIKGKLTVISRPAPGMVEVRCDCGTVKVIRQTCVAPSSNIISCGCAQRANRRKHGKHLEPIYGVWRNMLNRCNSPNRRDYPRYGGRGIKVCPAWAEFKAFYADMGEIPHPGWQIDRIDNDGPYSPDNCRWAPRYQQYRNRRQTRMITHDGQTMCARDWDRKLGYPDNTIVRRIAQGMPQEEAMQPLGVYRRAMTIDGREFTLWQLGQEKGVAYARLNKMAKAGATDAEMAAYVHGARLK